MTIDKLNKLTETGQLTEFYRAGIVSISAFRIRDACNLYLAYRKMGKTKSEAYFFVSQKLNCSERSVMRYIEKGGVNGR